MKNLNVLDSPVITIEGALVKKLLAKGTKSECPGYILIRNDTLENVVIEHIMDDSFNFKSLDPFEDKIVKATGKMWKGTLLTDKVEVVK